MNKNKQKINILNIINRKLIKLIFKYNKMINNYYKFK